MMIILVVLIVISVAGIGFVIWSLKNDTQSAEHASLPDVTQGAVDITDEATENKKEGPPSPEKLNLQPDLMMKLAAIKSDAEKPKDPSSQSKSTTVLGGVLNKFKPGKKDADDEIPAVTPLPNLKEYYGDQAAKRPDTKPDQKVSPPRDEPEPVKQDKTAEEQSLPKEEENQIEKEIELTTELNELKEKYDKLDSMFNEKNLEFEKTKDSLDSELKNRKEFNKVKDLLEKELKDSKDKTRDAHAALNNTQKKRNTQLDEKASKLEKDLLKKEDKFTELMQQKQASINPPANVKPESDEEKKKEETVPEPIPPSSQPQTGEQSTETQVQSPQTDAPVQSESTGDKTPPRPESPKQENPSQQANPESANTDDEKKEGAGEPQEDKFLKLQPDILTNEPKKEEPAPPEVQTEKTGGFKLDLSIDEEDKPKAGSEEEPSKNSPDNDVIL